MSSKQQQTPAPTWRPASTSHLSSEAIALEYDPQHVYARPRFAVGADLLATVQSHGQEIISSVRERVAEAIKGSEVFASYRDAVGRHNAAARTAEAHRLAAHKASLAVREALLAREPDPVKVAELEQAEADAQRVLDAAQRGLARLARECQERHAAARQVLERAANAASTAVRSELRDEFDRVLTAAAAKISAELSRLVTLQWAGSKLGMGAGAAAAADLLPPLPSGVYGQAEDEPEPVRVPNPYHNAKPRAAKPTKTRGLSEDELVALGGSIETKD